MSQISRQNLIEKKLKYYNEDEFYCLINIIDNKELIKPIKKNSKKFIQDTKGWRIDKLDKNKLKEIYFKYVYKKREPNLSVNLVTLINKSTLGLIEAIELKVDNIEEVKLQIKNNNKIYIDKIIDVLLDTNYGANTLLCFKLMEIALDEENTSYIEKVMNQKKMIREEKVKIIKDVTIKFNEQLKEAEKKYNEIVKNKEKEIKELNSNIDCINKKFAIELDQKEIELIKLKENIAQKERKFNLEIDKLNKKISDLEQKLDNSNVKLEESKEINDRKEEKINVLSYLLEDKYNTFDKYAKERWESENEKLQLRNRDIQNCIRELEVHKQCIEEEVSMLSKDKENMQKIINSLENKSEEFINNITYVMNRIGKAEITEDEIIKTRQVESIGINHIPSRLIEEDPEIKADKFDFIDDLADNFECIGIGNDFTCELAKYVYATITNKMGIFVMGYNNRVFADAISYTISNSTSETIVIPPGFTDSALLINTVKELQSKVVLIESAIDNIAESVYMPLLKENKDKILIFSMESSEDINIIPKSIFNYLMAVDLDLILESEQKEELYACITPDNIFRLNKDKDVKKSSKLFKGVCNIVNLSNISKIKILEINNIINNLVTDKNSEDGIYSLLLFSLISISKSQEMYDKIENFIKGQNFDHKKLDNLELLIGMENQDEQ